MSKKRIQTIYFSIYNFEMLLRSNRKYSLFHLRFRNAFKDESKISLFPFTISKCLKKRIQTIYFSIYYFEMPSKRNLKYSSIRLQFENAFKNKYKTFFSVIFEGLLAKQRGEMKFSCNERL